MEHTTGSVTLTFALPNPTTPKFMRVKDCAKILGVSYNTMRSIIRSETGPPHINLNGRHYQSVRIAYDDFMKWIERKYSCTP